MKIFNFYLKHRKLSILRSRLLIILKRYGLTGNKIQKCIQAFNNIAASYNVQVTLPITANVLKKNTKKINDIDRSNIELAIHGYNHIDYSQLSYDQQLDHFDSAIDIFTNSNIDFNGFRCPYLRYNDDTFKALVKHHFVWDSSHVIYWDVLNGYENNANGQSIYEKVLNQYDVKSSDLFISLPQINNDLIEIPVSLPDDDLLIDRMGIQDSKTLSQIWHEILRQTHDRGELFTIQLHPERYFIFEKPLEELIKTAQSSTPKTWITSLSQIADWWKEKENNSTTIRKTGDDRFEIQINQAAERAVLLLKQENSRDPKFYKNYGIVDKSIFTVETSKKPIIGIANDSSPLLTNYLKNEGFIFEISENRDDYAIYLNQFNTFKEEDQIKVLALIEEDLSPLVRFWRWPGGYVSAMAITGDIDGIKFFDFVSRFLSR